MPKFSILIIEDEKNIQTFMRKILIRHDYRLLCRREVRILASSSEVPKGLVM